MIARAYAKINWFLQVTGRRDNGYHELEMILQHIDLYDTLIFNPISGNQIDFEIINSEILSANDSNLVIKAAKLLREAGKITNGLHIRLEKNIPVGAGLGGGSADAAAVLHALNSLYSLKYPLKKLQDIAVKLGADVPYCLEEGPAIVKGIGENISPILIHKEYSIVLLKPTESLSTKDVFLRYSQLLPSLENLNIDLNISLKAIQNNKFSLLSRKNINSLENPAKDLLPAIQVMKKDLYDQDALFVQMSGSGSAVFGVFNSYRQAKQTWLLLQHKYPICLLSKTLKVAKAIPLMQSSV